MAIKLTTGDISRIIDLLNMSYENGKLAKPDFPSTVGQNLGVNFEEPRYTPMQEYIDSNTPAPAEGQEGRLKISPIDALQTPTVCLRISRAVEWIHHGLPDELVRTCLPAEVKKYSGYGYDVEAHEGSIQTNVRNVSNRTIDRAFVLGAWYFQKNISQKGLLTAFSSKKVKDYIEYIMGPIKPEHILFLFKDSWDAVSFPFLFHEGVRKKATEEAIRVELKRYITITAGVLVYDIFRFCLQIPSKIPAENYDIRAGRDKVAANYRMMPTWGPLSEVNKGIGRLPASARFDMKERVTKSKKTSSNVKTSNLPDAEGW
ncbi:hypothetical protein V498_04791 [Pseudogymnoascus sp. VKM F-4517 (FW-2822)]|nr:hypothetical protein V498_04791 [Pseudogymnoascus sp. VKM F-4517 (FW-2822)]